MLCAILAVFSGQSFAEELPQVDIPEVKVVGKLHAQIYRTIAGPLRPRWCKADVLS